MTEVGKREPSVIYEECIGTTFLFCLRFISNLKSVTRSNARSDLGVCLFFFVVQLFFFRPENVACGTNVLASKAPKLILVTYNNNSTAN